MFICIDIKGDAMSQEEVLHLLLKNRNKWLSTKEIQKKLKLSYGTAQSNMFRLRRAKDVEYKIIKVKHGAASYYFKHKPTKRL